MHDAHLALSELALILLRDVVHDHVLDELSLRLSKLHLTVCYAEVHRDRSCDRLCGNELRLLCAAQRSAELLGDHHPGTNGRNLDDHDLLEDGHATPEQQLTRDELHADLEALLEELTSREAAVIRLRYGLEDDTPQTLSQIGEDLHLSRERVRQIESRALLKLRQPQRRCRVQDYMRSLDNDQPSS